MTIPIAYINSIAIKADSLTTMNSFSIKTNIETLCEDNRFLEELVWEQIVKLFPGRYEFIKDCITPKWKTHIRHKK